MKRALVAAYVYLVKSSIDLGQEDAGIGCIDYFDNTFAPSSFGRDTYASHDAAFVAGCLLTCYAWILLRVEVRDATDMQRLRSRVGKSFSRRSTWEALKSASGPERLSRASWNLRWRSLA